MTENYKVIEMNINENVAIIKMNNPPVNQLSEVLVMELSNAIRSCFEDKAIEAVIVTGSGKNFIAGADITELKQVKSKINFIPKVMENHWFLNGIEAGPKPVIAAINGNCLGGGLEFAMACHNRIAVKGANIGLVEVQVGLIPGGGGTQRLPRLVGLSTASDMITGGQSIKSEKAEKIGLINKLVAPDELLSEALNTASLFISKRLDLNMNRTINKTDRLPSPAEKKSIIASAKQIIKEKAKGYLAPFKAIDAFERGLSHDFQADLEVETDLFCDCLVSDVAKNLIGIFLNTRSAGRLKRLENIQPRRIKKVGVLGSGVMGSGIVNLLLRGRFETILWDINDEAIEKGIAAIRRTFAYPIKKKKMTEKDLDTLIQERLRTTRSLLDMKEVDLVIETVLEDMKVKQDLWKKIESVCPSDAVFGTNTSALPITEMASVLSDPGRIIGLHFFNPAERMQLLEIICTRQTSNETLAASVAFARAIQKVPIVVNDGPGFYVSRQLSALMNGFYLLVADGVDPMSVEEAVLDFGMPMGPPTLCDLTGIDVAYHVAKTFERVLGERYQVHPLTEKIYGLGLYGRKSGSGWFDYSGDQPVLNKKVLHIVSEYLEENGIARKSFDKKDILDLLLADAINDASYMIEQGICDRPQDMDLAMIYGTGFPPYRGGLLRYADAWGINKIYEKLLELEKTKGVRFRPSDLLKTMVSQKRNFYSN